MKVHCIIINSKLGQYVNTFVEINCYRVASRGFINLKWWGNADSILQYRFDLVNLRGTPYCSAYIAVLYIQYLRFTHALNRLYCSWAASYNMPILQQYLLLYILYNTQDTTTRILYTIKRIISCKILKYIYLNKFVSILK